MTIIISNGWSGLFNLDYTQNHEANLQELKNIVIEGAFPVPLL